MCNCGAKKAGQMIAGFAGATALFALIVMIIAAATLSYKVDVAIMQKCPATKGSYATDCKDAVVTRRLLSAEPTVASLPSMFTPRDSAAFFADALKATVKSIGSQTVQTNKKTPPRSLREIEYLLASRVLEGKPTCMNTDGRYTSFVCGSGTRNNYSRKDCKGPSCTAAECCKTATDYGALMNGGCVACCGVSKTKACMDDRTATDKPINDSLKQFQEIANYGALAAIAGVVPALLGALGKMKDSQCIGNTCGAISLFSTFIFSVAVSLGLSYYLTLIGAFIYTMCASVQTEFDTYSAGPTCNAECLAAQEHLLGAVCDLGKGFGSVGMCMFIVSFLGLLTTIMVCIGFCNNKNEVAPQTVVNVQMTGVTPVVQGTVVKN